MRVDAAAAWDNAEMPEARLRCIANQIAGLVEGGELNGASPPAVRSLAQLPTLLLDIAGDIGVQRTERVPVRQQSPSAKVVEGICALLAVLAIVGSAIVVGGWGAFFSILTFVLTIAATPREK